MPEWHQYLPQQTTRAAVEEFADAGATFLLNTAYGPDEVWEQLPREVQRAIREKGLRLWVVDGERVARDAGLGGRINTVMQTCFFALSSPFPRDEAIALVKQSIEKTYGKRGATVVERNFAAVDRALEGFLELIPAAPEVHLAELGDAAATLQSRLYQLLQCVAAPEPMDPVML